MMTGAGALRGIAYLAASMLFILSLRGLSTQESARRGNAFGTLGMLIAVLVTAVALLLPGPSATGGGELAPNSLTSLGVLGAALGIGCVVGGLLAARVAMTSMPELVAMLHSFVGAAAVLVGIATYLQPGAEIAAAPTVHRTENFIGVLVGAVTFSGSIVAFGKLRVFVGSKPQ
jgi:NAD(P) transhydrogenase subunit beta